MLLVLGHVFSNILFIELCIIIILGSFLLLLLLLLEVELHGFDNLDSVSMNVKDRALLFVFQHGFNFGLPLGNALGKLGICGVLISSLGKLLDASTAQRGKVSVRHGRVVV